MSEIIRVKTIAEYHQTRGLNSPGHTLISVIDYRDINMNPEFANNRWLLDFYLISLKRNFGNSIRYGQQSYDFDEGVMFFIAPGQVFSLERGKQDQPGKSGWMLLIHPDFIWATSLAKTIRNYDFFGYTVNEALFVSPSEEVILENILANIKREYHANIDKFSQGIIISQVETLLNYAERFYNRQFITRKKSGHQLLTVLDELVSGYFNHKEGQESGLPSVHYFAERMNMSPKYLSSLLKAYTGQTVQQLIHEKLIDKAKELLSTSNLSVSEIAYQLGFGQSQSFSKIFKNKTSISPQDFRRSFNGN